METVRDRIWGTRPIVRMDVRREHVVTRRVQIALIRPRSCVQVPRPSMRATMCFAIRLRCAWGQVGLEEDAVRAALGPTPGA